MVQNELKLPMWWVAWVRQDRRVQLVLRGLKDLWGTPAHRDPKEQPELQDPLDQLGLLEAYLTEPLPLLVWRSLLILTLVSIVLILISLVLSLVVLVALSLHHRT